MTSPLADCKSGGETGFLIVLTLIWAGLKEIARVDTEMTRALYLAGSETLNAPSDRQVVLYQGRPLSSWRGRLALFSPISPSSSGTPGGPC